MATHGVVVSMVYYYSLPLHISGLRAHQFFQFHIIYFVCVTSNRVILILKKIEYHLVIVILVSTAQKILQKA